MRDAHDVSHADDWGISGECHTCPLVHMLSLIAMVRLCSGKEEVAGA